MGYMENKDFWNLKETITTILVFSIICISMTLFLLFYSKKIGDQFLIFNREEGTVKMPLGYHGVYEEFDFNKMEFYIGYGTAQMGARHLGIRYPGNKKAHNIVAGCTDENNASFLVWYMDKNRPLPPGDLFKQYRISDAKKFRDLGYPEPLYPMTKEIEELTKEFYKQVLNADISDEPIYNGDPGTEPLHAVGFYTYRHSKDPGKGIPTLKPEERSIFD